MGKQVCGRNRWHFPWWCTREPDHDGPCALHKRCWRFGK